MTCAEVPDLTPDDGRLRASLEERGAVVEAVAWDAPGVRWRDWDAVVLRSTWDYHRRPAAFLDWLEACEAEGVRLHNPPALVRWNHHKAYLEDLAARGIPVVPTELVRRDEPAALRRLLEVRGWSRAVVKPAIAASAWRTFRTDAASARVDEERFRDLVASGDVLIQPFLDEIETEGELSFVFIDGSLSHVALKRPASGDYRVQGEHGGAAEIAVPDPAAASVACGIAAVIPQPWLYARVDAVEREGGLELMELELIEPELFLALEPRAPERLAAAIVRVAGGPAPRSGTGRS